MRSTTDDRRAVDSAEATLARDIERTWRSWKAFVAERLDELAAQRADDAPEADLTGGTRPAQRKARIDGATRQQFGAVLEARRQQAQARAERAAREQSLPLPDADQVYAALLRQIGDELDGKAHPGGLALVWYKDSLLKFDAQALLSGTTDADYLAAEVGGPTKGQALALAGLLAGLLLALWVAGQWAFGAPAAAASGGSGTAWVGEDRIQLWGVDSAQIGARSVPASLRGGFPPTLCLPDRQVPADGATLVVTGTQAVRRYKLDPGGSAGEADLLLAECGSPSAPVAAQLVETQTHQLLGGELLLQLAVRGPDLEPQTIPADQMEVTLRLGISEAGAGALILADGRRLAATHTAPVTGGTELIYLAPLASAAQLAGWELARAGQLPALLPLTLPAPTSRPALLRQALVVQPAGATLIGPELAITLTLTLDGAAPLALQPDDLLAEVGGARLTPRWEPPALTPGAATTVVARLALRDRAPLEVELAGWRARFSFE